MMDTNFKTIIDSFGLDMFVVSDIDDGVKVQVRGGNDSTAVIVKSEKDSELFDQPIGCYIAAGYRDIKLSPTYKETGFGAGRVVSEALGWLLAQSPKGIKVNV